MRALKEHRTAPFAAAFLFFLAFQQSWAQMGATPAGVPPKSAGPANQIPVQSVTPLPIEPAFRLPAGGLALVAPILEPGHPASAWLLSEDGALYALTEGGALSARIPLKGQAAPFLALDPFGRALVLLDGSRLDVLTRSGSTAYSVALPSGDVRGIAFGSDGRAFILAGRELICLNPAGRRLWSRTLPAEASSPPAVDASGRPAVGLAGGSVLVLTPYGENAAEVETASGGRGASLALLIAPMATGTELPCMAAALADGSILFIGADGGPKARVEPGQARVGSSPTPFVDLVWDGAILHALDASGRLLALSAAGTVVWSVETRCPEGRISAFAERVIVTSKGRAVSFSTEGALFREIGVANASARALVAPSGLLFSPGRDWIFAAYRFEAPLGPVRLPELAPYPAPGGEEAASEALLFDPAAGDADRQLARLADIEKKLRSGSIGEDEVQAAAYCAALAAGSFEREYSDSERRFRGNPLPRATACAILGEMGSPDYRAALSEVLAKDPDPAVRAAACDALADIGVDPGGLSAAAFLVAARKPVDERTALGLVAAIERMALRSGTAPGTEAVRTLLALAAKPYGNAVRVRASEALGRIAGAIAP